MSEHLYVRMEDSIRFNRNIIGMAVMTFRLRVVPPFCATFASLRHRTHNNNKSKKKITIGPMKYTVAAISGIALLATSVVAFTAAPQGNFISNATPASRKSAVALNMSQDDFAKSEINANDVVVFSKTYCPYCTATKELFSSLGVKYAVHELDKMEDGAELQNALFRITGQRSVPNVFVKGSHMGGNDE
jgi:glutaredoxin 3